MQIAIVDDRAEDRAELSACLENYMKKNPAYRILRLRRGATAALFLSAAVRSSRSVFDFIG